MASFFTRDKTGLALNSIDKSSPTGLSHPQVILPTPPKAAAWSPDGTSLAVVDSARGILSIYLGVDVGDTEVRLLPNSSKITQMLWWSPKGTFLVSHHPVEKQEAGSDARSSPNLLVWDRLSAEVVACFLVPKIERGNKKTVLSWTADERLCCRVLPIGPKLYELHILPGEDLNSEPLHVISHPTAMICDWASLEQIADASIIGRLGVFCADGRNDMKRVCADAEVWCLDVCGPDISVTKTAEASISSGEIAELLWSPSGTALLAQVETEVDETGVSYYGSTRLVLLSADAKKEVVELNKDASGQYLPIQAVGWSPTSDDFVLIRGFQPSHVSLWRWDPLTTTVVQTQTLLEKSHRNTVKWNPFGNLLLLAGFGNLAGDMDIFGVTKDKKSMAKLFVLHANCTVTVDWCPDGCHILTAVLFPRMRVENGLSIVDALSGKTVSNILLDELLEVDWRPIGDNQTYSPPSQETIDKMAESFAATEPDKKQAYRPPKGRDGGTGNAVAAMMRGEVPMERSRQKGHRQERVQPSVRSAVDDDRPPRSPLPATDSSKEVDGRMAPSGSAPLPPVSQSASTDRQSKADALGDTREDEGLRGANRHQRHGEKLPCPPTGWQYVDPKGNVQGPFSLTDMQQWHTLGYFRQDLMMRCIGSDEFQRLDLLFPHPLIPFRSYPNRPGKKDASYPLLQ